MFVVKMSVWPTILEFQHKRKKFYFCWSSFVGDLMRTLDWIFCSSSYVSEVFSNYRTNKKMLSRPLFKCLLTLTAWDLNHLSRKCFTVFDHPHCKEILPNVQFGLLQVQFCAVLVCLAVWYWREESSILFHASLPQEILESTGYLQVTFPD